MCARTSYPGGCRQSRLLAGLLAYCALRMRNVSFASSCGSAPAFPFDRTVAGASSSHVVCAAYSCGYSSGLMPCRWQKHVPDSLLIHPVKDVEPTGVCERTGLNVRMGGTNAKAFRQNSKFGCVTRPAPRLFRRSVASSRRGSLPQCVAYSIHTVFVFTNSLIPK